MEGAVFELHAKETIYTPDGAVDENGNRIIRYEKDALVATLTTDEDGKEEFDEDLVCYDFSNWWDNMDDIEQVKEYRKHE